MVNVTRVLAAVSLVLFAGFWYGDPVWLMDASRILLVCCFATLFGILLILASGYGASRGFVTTAFIVGIISSIAGGMAIAVVSLLDLDASRLMVVFETALFFALLLVNLVKARAVVAATANVLAFVVTLYPSTVDGSLRELATLDRAPVDDSGRYILTSRHDVKVVDHVVFNQRQEAFGGGLAQIDDRRILLVSGEGQLMVLTLDVSGVGVVNTGLSFPLKRKEYVAGVKEANRWFRVTGVLLETRASGPRKLYVAHHDWNVEEKCLTLNLSETGLDFDHLPSRLDWTPRFKTSPCISGENLANETGGRLAFIDDDQILMTIGVHSTDGSLKRNRPSGSMYGTTVALRRSDWSARTFTTGHRNPQGLLVENGRIWSTEHGPQGGDELNVLVEGSDYGWPRSTYGTEYGGKSWPPSDGDDPHAVGTKPIWAWVPSIGVSNLIRVRGTAFPAWKSDLMVASLVGLENGYSMFRMKLDGERVVFVEKINTRLPIRDLVENSDGRFVLWDGVSTVQVVEPATHVFSPCSGCHAVSPNTHGIGPDLNGVVGERVARYTAYRYSNALRSLGGRWTRGRLDEFLRDPAAFAPGTTMSFPGIEDAQERASIIKYLDEIAESD